MTATLKCWKICVRFLWQFPYPCWYRVVLYTRQLAAHVVKIPNYWGSRIWLTTRCACCKNTQLLLKGDYAGSLGPYFRKVGVFTLPHQGIEPRVFGLFEFRRSNHWATSFVPLKLATALGQSSAGGGPYCQDPFLLLKTQKKSFKTEKNNFYTEIEMCWSYRV